MSEEYILFSVEVLCCEQTFGAAVSCENACDTKKVSWLARRGSLL
jgi:hypothetical protein